MSISQIIEQIFKSILTILFVIMLVGNSAEYSRLTQALPQLLQPDLEYYIFYMPTDILSGAERVIYKYEI